MADCLGKSRRSLSLLHIAAMLVIICSTLCTLVRSQDDDDSYQYSRGPLPQEFQFNMSYPDRTETEECRPIRLRIQRNSRLFRTRLVVNTNSDINFNNSDARIMTSRTQTRLNALAQLYYQRYRRRFTVMKSWAEYGDDDVDDPQSLHFEGQLVLQSSFKCNLCVCVFPCLFSCITSLIQTLYGVKLMKSHVFITFWREKL